MKKTLTLFVIALGLSITVTAQSPEFQWAVQFGGTGNDFSNSITTDATGNVYITGTFRGTVDFDPGSGIFNLSATSQDDLFVSKLDASGNLMWAKGMISSSNGKESYSIAVDASSNVYITGYFTGTVDFDPGSGIFNLSSSGYGDAFICKLDASGNFVWAKHFSGSFQQNETGQSIAVDASGNVYTTGFFMSKVDFDPGSGTYNLTAGGTTDIFISKLDASGNFVWAKQMGGTGSDFGQSITIDNTGNIYVTGGFELTADFDPGSGTYNLTSAGAGDIFISKLDASGNFVWAKRMGGASGNSRIEETGFSVKVDATGNVYTTGIFKSAPADFDPGSGTYNLSAAGYSDIFISKLDASGNFVWAKQFGSDASIGSEQGNTVALDAAGNVYTTGTFRDTVDFDPGSGIFNLIAPADGADIFISKLDASGNFIWAGRIGAKWSEWNSALALDADGNIYTTGSFQETGDFDPGAGTYNLTAVAGGYDFFVQKLKVGGCMGSNLTITTARDTVCTGTPAILSVAGGSGSVRWQSSVTGNSFTDIPGATGKEYISQDTVSSYFRAYSSNTSCPDTSAAFKLIITPSPVADFIMSSAGRDIAFTDRSKGAIVYHWDFGDGTTGTEQNPVHTYTTADTFHVCLTVYNGSNCSFTMCKDIEAGSVTGISKADRENNIRLYPNPFSRSILIAQQGMNNHIRSIEVYDLPGRKVYEQVQIIQMDGQAGNPESVMEVSLSDIPNGMYFVKIKTKEGNYIERVIKQ